MRYVSDKPCPQTKSKHNFMFSNFSENPAVYEILLKYGVQSDRPQMTL